MIRIPTMSFSGTRDRSFGFTYSKNANSVGPGTEDPARHNCAKILGHPNDQFEIRTAILWEKMRLPNQKKKTKKNEDSVLTDPQ